MKRVFIVLLVSLVMTGVMAQNTKTSLQHIDYDGWKNLKSQKISDTGEWITYEINPQKGDGFLYLYKVTNGKLDSVARGYDAEFSPDGTIVSFKIKAQYDTIRKAKLKKLEKEDLPKDSLGIWNTVDNKILRISGLKSVQMPKEKGEWMALLLETSNEEMDSTETNSEQEKSKSQEKKKNKKKTKKLEKGELVIRNFISGEEFHYSNVTDYSLARNGNAVSFIVCEGDSIQEASVKLFSGKNRELNTIFKKTGLAKKVSISSNGDQVSFIFSADTLENKTFGLYYLARGMEKPKLLVDTTNIDIQKGWTVSENGEIFFSRDGEKLFFGVAPEPVNEKRDTLLDEEKYCVDIWSWKDPLLQPQQKIQTEKESKRTYLAVFQCGNGQVLQLGNEKVPEIKLYDHGNAQYALGSSDLPYQQEISWADRYSDFYLVDTKTGKKELILKKKNSRVNLSPAQSYLLWFENQDSTWYSYHIQSKTTKTLTGKIKVNFYNEIHDMPGDPDPYGIVGWTKGDQSVLVRDRYDIWKLDPMGEKSAVNLTNAYGRRNKIRFDYLNPDEEELFIDFKKSALLSAFCEHDKRSGFFQWMEDEDPRELLFEDAMFTKPSFAKHGNQLIWNRSTFNDYPNLWVSSWDFSFRKKVSDANPQQKRFLWGDVDLVEWTSGDGEQLQGLLYKPENFDPNKKYPMLVYFYERSSDNLHRHFVPQPSWSIINPSYCVSNGYLVFMPDITYHKEGYPGECAYSSIVTGTLAMVDRYSFVDKNNIALQGQSWGGYQIAYLVTRTNLFKCAMAGAPVSNMTSAYGGIRWESGMSRMFQYERTQSRIGGTLWNSTLQYIENSPIFFAPKIETPLLIMHNDNDGAVPWYQGIELFVAMRRLQKPCWMLSYNDEAHNLKKRPNRMDLSIRMMQFFDYYLKGKPAPDWMVEGIPAIKKGKVDGYDLRK